MKPEAHLGDRERHEAERLRHIRRIGGRTAWYQAVRQFFRAIRLFRAAHRRRSFRSTPDALARRDQRAADGHLSSLDGGGDARSPCRAARSLNVPAGFNDRGLPMGMQIVGPNQAEFGCLQLAFAYDQATGWVNKRPPSLLRAA